jgi:hypothetical protein
LRTYLFGGIEYRGVVIDVNFYTVLIDEDQKRIIPNSSVIVSAITLNPQERKHVYTVPIPYPVSKKRSESIMTPYAPRRKIEYNGRKQERGLFYGETKMDRCAKNADRVGRDGAGGQH